MHTPWNSNGRCLSWHETAAPKPLQSRASWYTKESLKNPRILAFSGNLHSTSGSQDQTVANERWTKHLDHESCQALTLRIKSYPLARAYNRNPNDKRRNTTYLSLPRLGGRMILLPAPKVNVSDIAIYRSSISISPSLTWRESRFKPCLLAPELISSFLDKLASISKRRSSAGVFVRKTHVCIAYKTYAAEN